MKFAISRDALIKPLNLVAGVVERRQTLPILSNVLLVLEDKTLSLTGTDLEVELVGRVAIDADPGLPGGGIKEKGLPYRLRLRNRFCFNRPRCRLESVSRSIDAEVEHINDDFDFDRFNDDFTTTTPTTRRQVGGFESSF